MEPTLPTTGSFGGVSCWPGEPAGVVFAVSMGVRTTSARRVRAGEQFAAFALVDYEGYLVRADPALLRRCQTLCLQRVQPSQWASSSVGIDAPLVTVDVVHVEHAPGIDKFRQRGHRGRKRQDGVEPHGVGPGADGCASVRRWRRTPPSGCGRGAD